MYPRINPTTVTSSNTNPRKIPRIKNSAAISRIPISREFIMIVLPDDLSLFAQWLLLGSVAVSRSDGLRGLSRGKAV